jgi:hypothetical protein
MKRGFATTICLLLPVLLSGCIANNTDFSLSEDGQGHNPNVFRALDSAASITNESNDTLMSIRWTEAYHEMNWAEVSVNLMIGDTLYACSISGGDPCLISQDGDDDSIWEVGEFLTLSENDEDITGMVYGVTIEIRITYRGELVPGTSSVIVH